MWGGQSDSWGVWERGAFSSHSRWISPPSPALPQANPGTNLSLNDPPPAPHPHGPGQPSASRPPSFDQYRASSQGGCKLHPPRRPQLSRGHMGEGCSQAPGFGGRSLAREALGRPASLPGSSAAWLLPCHKASVHRSLASTNHAPGAAVGSWDTVRANQNRISSWG